MSFQLGNAYGRIDIDGGGAVGAINAVSRGLMGLGGGSGAFGLAATGALGLGAALTAGVAIPVGAAGLALGGMISSSVKVAATLEEQMSNIQAVMGASSEEVAKLDELINNLGMDPNLKVSSLEAAQAIEMLGRNGLSVTEILDGAAHSTVLLANATKAEFGTAADIMTDAMALFGIAAEDATEAVDGIASVVVNSKMDINNYALALAQGGGVAAAAGVDFDDFNAAIAGISPLFASGSDAGTSFKTFLQRLVPTTDKAAGAMSELGLEFFDSNGQMKSMDDIAGQLNQALYGTINVMTEVGGRTGEQQEELDRLKGIYDKTTTSISDYESGIKGANLTEDKRQKKLAELRAQLAAVEQQMIPLEAIQGEMVATTKQLTEEERNHYMTTIFGTDAIRAAAGMAQLGADGFRELQASMGETDAAAMARIQMENLVGAMEIFDGVVETIKKRIGNEFLPLLERGYRQAAQFLTDNADSIVAFFSRIADGAEYLAGVAKPALDNLLPALNSLFDLLTGAATVSDYGNLLQFFTSLGLSADSAGAVVGAIAGIRDGVEGFVAGLPGYIESVSGFASGLIAAFQEGGFAGLADYVWSWVGGAQETGPEIMTGLITFISNFLLEQWPAISAALSSWKDKFFDWLNGPDGAISRVGEALTGFAAAMLLWSQDPATQATMSQIGLGLADGLIGALQTLSEDQTRIAIITAALFTMMASVGVLALETFMNAGQSLAGGFISGIVAWITGGEPSTQLSTVIGELWNGVMQTIISTIMPVAALAFAVGQFNDIRDRVSEMDWLGIGTNLIDGMIEGVTGGAGRLATAVYDAAQAAWDAATEFWQTNSPSKRMDELYQNVMAGGVQGIEAGSGALVDASTATAVAVGDAAAGVAGGASAFAQSLQDSLSSSAATSLPVPTASNSPTAEGSGGGGITLEMLVEALESLASGGTNINIHFQGGEGAPKDETEADSAGFLIANALKRRGFAPG